MNFYLDQTDLLLLLILLMLAFTLGLFFYLRSTRAELLAVIRRLVRRHRCFGVPASLRDRTEDLFPWDN